MRRVAAALLLAALPALAGSGEARRGAGGAGRGAVVLSGERAEVRWNDGDSFQILSGVHAGRRARLVGVNALESYGPVHRLGRADGAALLAVALRSREVASAAGGPCEERGTDRYGRLLLRCPEAAEALVRAGHAMVLAVDAPPEPALVALQAEAQRRGAGLWSGGVPALVPTSLHSADERDLGRGGAYDRLVDTRTGASEVRPHRTVYRPCEEVCVGDGGGRACLVYVPFERRYRDRPACLRRPPSGAARRAR